MGAVVCKNRRCMNTSQDLSKCHYGKLCFVTEKFLVVVIFIQDVIFVLRCLFFVSPDDEESVTIVLVRCSLVLIRDTMDYLCNLIDEAHDVLLEHLSGSAKVTDSHHSGDALLHLGAFNHGVDATTATILHVVAYDSGAGHSEAQCQKGSQLDDCLFQNNRLHRLLHRSAPATPEWILHELQELVFLQSLPSFLLLLLLELLVCHLHGLQRTGPNGLNSLNHLLHRLQNEPVCVVGEEERCYT
mmetsp:Transcript_10544/g.23977  ORF Transcript_10544/g.23977 Transcript_10544/m.23977 type:complete len:243 (+) Transcript_10544:836-1564(+)